MGERAQKPATYEDVLRAPPNMVAEILAGELFLQPRPRARHARSASRLGALLAPADFGDDGVGGWILLDEPELHLREDIVVPDLAGWRRETMPEMPDTAYFTTRPDWVCEVLSTSTALRDRAQKLPIYAREGVSHVWLVDPEIRTLEVFRLDAESYRLVVTEHTDARCRLEPFPEIELNLGWLWTR